jgi:uncharacterized membrane protein YvlD (DUF360 family)
MIKKFLKFSLLFIFALIATNQIWQNLEFLNTPTTYLKVAFILALFEILLKPIIKILLLPINFLTLGTIRLVIDTLGLYLATFFLEDFSVGNIVVTNATWQGITIPDMHFENFFAYLVSSLTIGFLIYIYKLILNKKEVKK